MNAIAENQRLIGYLGFLTPGNEDDNPKYPEPIAERIFRDLKERNLFAYFPVEFDIGGQKFQTANLSPVKEPKWLALISDDSIWRVYIWPTLKAIWKHPKITLLVAAQIALVGVFLNKWVENYSHFLYYKWFPSALAREVPASQQKTGNEGAQQPSNSPRLASTGSTRDAGSATSPKAIQSTPLKLGPAPPQNDAPKSDDKASSDPVDPDKAN